MARINDHYRKLQAGYLFPEIGRRVAAFQKANPDAQVIKLGIGDVTLPLVPAVVAGACASWPPAPAASSMRPVVTACSWML